MAIFLAIVATTVGVGALVFLLLFAIYRGPRANLRALNEWGGPNGWQVEPKPSHSVDLPDAFIDRVVNSREPVKVRINSVLSRRNGDHDELALNVTASAWGSRIGMVGTQHGQFEHRLGAVAISVGRQFPDLTLVDPRMVSRIRSFNSRSEQALLDRRQGGVLDFYRVAPSDVDRLPSSFTPQTMELLLESPFCLHLEDPWVAAVFPGHVGPDDVIPGLELLGEFLSTISTDEH